MNIYARYFNQEVLAHSYDELMSFLTSIPEIPVTPKMEEEVRAYIESDMPYPKRFKIRPRVYFIMIKTVALSMTEFKAHQKGDAEPENKERYTQPVRVEMGQNKKELRMAELLEERYGWYFGMVVFKRVIQIAGTQKFRYQDTDFQAYVHANSGMDCYNKIIDHLKRRTEIDLRSQFPSARGSNFSYDYVGTELPTEGEEY